MPRFLTVTLGGWWGSPSRSSGTVQLRRYWLNPLTVWHSPAGLGGRIILGIFSPPGTRHKHLVEDHIRGKVIS